MARFPEAGKIQEDFFKELLFPLCGFRREEVITGPGYGVDVSVVRLPNEMAMALTSDPLTLIPSLGLRESAWLSVHILANDMATTGFAPQYAQFVLNLPDTLTAEDFASYWQYIHEYCEQTGIAITGGHTGQVSGQKTTIAGGGTFITIAPEKDIRTSNGAQPGDAILITKQPAMTAASILAMSFPKTVQNKAGKEVFEKACAAFYQTSSLKDALIAAEESSQITAMHDVTEGGILGALYEMATASHCGMRIHESDLPKGYAQEAVCNIFELDPYRVVGAGSMIIAVKVADKDTVMTRLQQQHIPVIHAGHFTQETEGKMIHTLSGEEKEIHHIGTDPYWSAFFKAYAEGWK